MIERADMPGPGDPGIHRGKTVPAHQHRRKGSGPAGVDHLADAAMVGIEDPAAPRLDRVAGKTFVAGYHRRFADARDRTWRVRRPVAVDHQPRIALRDQGGAEMFR